MRPDWREYFLNLAKAVSLRGDCSRRQVGCVVVDSDNRVCSTGYNGTAPGGPSCLKGDCPRARSTVEPGSSYDTGPGACISTHAEANALLYADYSRLKGATVYVSEEPCGGCRKLLDAMPLKAIVWPSGQTLKE